MKPLFTNPAPFYFPFLFLLSVTLNHILALITSYYILVSLGGGYVSPTIHQCFRETHRSFGYRKDITMSTDYIKVYKRTTKAAGCFYTNVVRKVVSVLGANATFQQGNSGGQKVLYWFINDDIETSGLPDVAYGMPDGDVISEDDYKALVASQGSTASDDVEGEQPTSF